LVRLDPLFGQFYSALRLYGQHRYLPYRRWFRTQLATHIQQVLTDTRVRQSGFWNPGFTERLAWEHITGRKNYLREINAVLTLEAIERLLIRNQSKAVERQSDLNNCEASSS
jgi:hypothetical protein